MTDEKTDDTTANVGSPVFTVGAGTLMEQLEIYLQPLGLERVKGLAAATFEGQIQGHRVRIGCAMRSRHQYLGIGNASYRTFQGWILSLTVDSDFGTRLVASNRKPAAWARFLLAWRKLCPVDGLPENFFAHANEPEWAGEFLRKTAADPVFRLFTNDIEADRSLGIGPFNVTMTFSLTAIPDNGERLANWIDDCLELTALAHSHPPTQIINPTWMERLNEEDPKKAALITALSLLFGIPLVLLAFILILGTILLIIGGPKLLAIGAICFAAILMPISMGFLLWRMLFGNRASRR